MPPYRNDGNGACEREKFRRGGRLRIGCVFGSRKGTFCRVLHTQVLGVSEFPALRRDLRIRRSEDQILLGAPLNLLLSTPAKTLHRQFAYANHSSFADTKNGASPDLLAELL